MKQTEINGHWYDELLNAFPLCIDNKYVKTVGVAFGFKELGKWNFIPRITGDAQYYNALFFIRLGIPFSFFIHFRINSSKLVQLGLGYKQNGRVGIHFRLQTDDSSTKGYHAGADNLDHASGYNYGKH